MSFTTSSVPASYRNYESCLLPILGNFRRFLHVSAGFSHTDSHTESLLIGKPTEAEHQPRPMISAFVVKPGACLPASDATPPSIPMLLSGGTIRGDQLEAQPTASRLITARMLVSPGVPGYATGEKCLRTEPTVAVPAAILGSRDARGSRTSRTYRSTKLRSLLV